MNDGAHDETHVILTDPGNEPYLERELQRAYCQATVRANAPGLVKANFTLQAEAPPVLVFARQVLPYAIAEQAASVHQWADRLFETIAGLPDDQPWHLHVVPHYGAGRAGQNRCQLIHAALTDRLRRKRRHLLKCLQPAPIPFQQTHAIVQLLLNAPDAGFVSLARAPLAFQLRRLVWPFPKGEVPVAVDKSAPSRAFAKLLEAEQRLGLRIRPGETCVDLGASPGSWSYVALRRGARVIAVDRAPLRTDLMSHPRLRFIKGDAFKFEPPSQVDCLLCDVIAAPSRTVDLLVAWARERRARRFIVTIKFKGDEDYAVLERLKYALPALCDDFYLTRLSSNKNEACAFGVVQRAF